MTARIEELVGVTSYDSPCRQRSDGTSPTRAESAEEPVDGGGQSSAVSEKTAVEVREAERRAC